LIQKLALAKKRKKKDEFKILEEQIASNLLLREVTLNQFQLYEITLNEEGIHWQLELKLVLDLIL